MEDAIGLSEGGLVCLWSVQEPSRPQQLLCCRASPVAATFSPSKPSLVLAGLEDGSLAAWDLREHFKFHSLKIEIDDVKWRVRVPSFITGNTLCIFIDLFSTCYQCKIFLLKKWPSYCSMSCFLISM